MRPGGGHSRRTAIVTVRGAWPSGPHRWVANVCGAPTVWGALSLVYHLNPHHLGEGRYPHLHTRKRLWWRVRLGSVAGKVGLFSNNQTGSFGRVF